MQINAVGQCVADLGELADGKALQNILHGIDAARFETAGTHDIVLEAVTSSLRAFYSEVLDVDLALLAEVDVAAIRDGSDARDGFPNVSSGVAGGREQRRGGRGVGRERGLSVWCTERGLACGVRVSSARARDAWTAGSPPLSERPRGCVRLLLRANPRLGVPQ